MAILRERRGVLDRECGNARDGVVTIGRNVTMGRIVTGARQKVRFVGMVAGCWELLRGKGND